MKRFFSILLFLLLANHVNSQVYLSGGALSFPAAPYCSGDEDAQKFVTATGITDATQIDNICWLVDTLKATGLWSHGQAIYPLIGGTAAKHAYNLKDTTAYKLTYTGTVNHSSTGMAGNGSTGYANTSFNPTTVWTDALGSIALYSRTSGAAAGTITEMGASPATYLANTSIFIRFSDLFYGLVDCIGIASSTANTESHGFYLASRVSTTAPSNKNFIQKNATQTQFNETSATTNLNIYIMAINEDNVAKNFSSKELTFVWIGKPLTTNNATHLYNVVLRWNTKNSR